MLNEILANFAEYKKGYAWKNDIDSNCQKNMDAFTADVVNSKYLPQYSSREPDRDYQDRLNRAKNAYMNFPQKIISIYQNSIFRSGSPSREGDSDAFKRFIKDCDGRGTTIGDFVKEEIFIINQVHGGSFIVIDMPRKPDNDTLTVYQQQQLKFFPYAYLYTWPEMINFGIDRYRNLDWILFEETYTGSDKQYRYFDKNYWAILDKEGHLVESGVHGLGVVPVIASFAKRNPKHRFLTPQSPIDDVIRLSLKIFEYQSQLEQMIVAHAFMKLAMPEGMWKLIDKQGMGNFNALVFPDDLETKAYYIESSLSEIEKMIELVYEKLPNKILYFATIRDKVAMPREESGQAKFIDSADEIANLLEKANQMERIENQMVDLALKWQDVNDNFQIIYNKTFDIKSTNEQIEEVVKIFKQDMGSPTFNLEIVKRLMFNMLGEVPEKIKKEIEEDLKYSYDPSLSLDDIDSLTNFGILNAIKLAKKYNPELRNKTDSEVRKFISKNTMLLPGMNSATSIDSNLGEEDTTAAMLNGIQIKSASEIIKSVSSGDLPRESGINQLMVFLNLTREQAEKVMGTAGTGKVIKKDKVVVGKKQEAATSV